MKPLLALTAFALLLAAACSTGDAAPATKCPAAINTPYPAISPLARIPEGTLVLATDPSVIYTLNSGCGAVPVAKSNYAWTSPDGSATAITLSSGQYSTGVGVVTSEGPRTLAEWNKTVSFGTTTAWSRNGRLAYNTPTSESEPAGVWTWDGGEPKRVLTGAESSPLGWTADGNVIVSSPMKHLEIVDESGKSVQSTDMPFEGYAAGYVVSPDETKLAVISSAAGTNDTPPRGTGLWLYDIASNSWQRLAEFGATVSSAPGSGLFVSADALSSVAAARKGPPPPTWSPDSTRIAYYRDYTDADQVYHNDLWTHELRSGKDTLVSDGQFAYADSWSPDSKYLALRMSDPTEVWLLNEAGERVEIPEAAGSPESVGWLADGRLIISSGAKLELYDPRNGKLDELRVSGESIVGASVYGGGVYTSPSGRYASFQVPSDGGGPYAYAKNKQPGVYIIDTKTNEVTRLTNDGAAYVSGWLKE